MELHVDLKNESTKVGSLVVKLNGLRFDMGNASSSGAVVSSAIPVHVGINHPPNPVASESPNPAIVFPVNGNASPVTNGVSGDNGVEDSQNTVTPTGPLNGVAAGGDNSNSTNNNVSLFMVYACATSTMYPKRGANKPQNSFHVSVTGTPSSTASTPSAAEQKYC